MAFVILCQLSSFLSKVGHDVFRLAEFPIFVTRVAVIACKLSNIHTEESLMECDAVLQPGALVKGIEGNLLDEGYAVHLYVVALGSKLHVFVLLASYYGADVGLSDADDSVRDALAGVIALKMAILLAIDFGDDVDV